MTSNLRERLFYKREIFQPRFLQIKMREKERKDESYIYKGIPEFSPGIYRNSLYGSRIFTHGKPLLNFTNNVSLYDNSFQVSTMTRKHNRLAQGYTRTNDTRNTYINFAPLLGEIEHYQGWVNPLSLSISRDLSSAHRSRYRPLMMEGQLQVVRRFLILELTTFVLRLPAGVQDTICLMWNFRDFPKFYSSIAKNERSTYYNYGEGWSISLSTLSCFSKNATTRRVYPQFITHSSS